MQIRSPRQITESTLDVARAKVALPTSRLAVQAVMAGAFIALGGMFSVIAGCGFPEVTAANPSLQRLLSGMTFPIGLILVVVLGAELFTGNNATMIPGLIKGEHDWKAVARNWFVVYFGNFLGALLFAWGLVYCADLTAADPYHSAVIRSATVKTSLPWLTVLLRGIGANWCVCLAVWLALAGKTLAEKMLGCFFPVMAFVVLGYEHCIANMFFIPLGMMEGAQVSVGQFVWANLIPATIGNIIGGAVFVGCVNAWVHLLPRKNC
ncbi:MAG: formate/nitrite transporter family protein [Paramuribaculum sp.]|nr:formate/nitrite transporter family protein [Paramuribaculum sp.]MDE6783268.1 formate/nitrite transporter family protein [Paramuribaculum sp.]